MSDYHVSNTVENGVALGKKAFDKSNAIAAIPSLFDLLDVKSRIGT